MSDSHCLVPCPITSWEGRAHSWQGSALLCLSSLLACLTPLLQRNPAPFKSFQPKKGSPNTAPIGVTQCANRKMPSNNNEQEPWRGKISPPLEVTGDRRGSQPPKDISQSPTSHLLREMPFKVHFWETQLRYKRSPRCPRQDEDQLLIFHLTPSKC